MVNGGAIPFPGARRGGVLVMSGRPLAEYCATAGKPSLNTINNWRHTNDIFAKRFSQARDIGFDSIAERLRTALVAAYNPKDVFVSLATGVLGTHVGLGAWAVFYQVEDGAPMAAPQA